MMRPRPATADRPNRLLARKPRARRYAGRPGSAGYPLHRSRRPQRRALLLGTLTCAVTICLAPSVASAQPAWWHLTSGTRPAYLHGGQGQTEVKKLIVQQGAGSYFLEEPTSIEQKGAELNINYVELPFNATVTEVKAGLELLYGTGNVEVTEPASKEFTITFKAQRGFQPVKLTAEGEVTITQLSAGRPDGEVYLTAENLGEQTVSGAKSPVRISDVLPPGLKAVGIAGTAHAGPDVTKPAALPCSLSSLSCTLSQPGLDALAPYDQIEVRVAVVVEPGASSLEENTVNISGGEAFVCRTVSAGTGSFGDASCVGEPQLGGFERELTGPLAPDSISRQITVNPAATPFGIEDYELAGEEDGGGPATQAGVHPFQLTTTVTLNQTADGRPLENVGHKASVNSVALPKDVHFQWPPGLIGNPSPFPQCSDEQFFTSTDSGAANLCPPSSAVGAATVAVNEPGAAAAGVVTVTVPLFNLHPAPGEPARFGFNVTVGSTPVFIDTAVRTGGDYGITVKSDNIVETTSLLSAQVTVWGVPGDPRHNQQRGWSCLLESRGAHVESPLLPCAATETFPEQHPPPFLSLPTSCTGAMSTTVLGDSWANPLAEATFPTLATSSLPGLEGCNRLPFAAELKVAPDGQAASTPTGLKVNVHVPQNVNTNSAGLASSNVRNIAVTFPEGVTLNPAAADGLQACNEAQVGLLPGRGAQEEFLFTPTLPEAFCPDAAKIGTVAIFSPLLPAGQPLQGALYLATPAPNGEPANNPFNSLVAMYIIAKDPISGTLVKLPGQVTLDQSTGRITATFQNTPQLAFEDAEIHLLGGERAPLSTPAHCGTYTTDATFTPWSGGPPITSSSSFEVKTGPNGTACPPAALPFTPSLTAGSPNISAGSFSPLNTTITREDGDQNINKVQLHFAPGMSGILAGVPLCPEAEANAGTCPESSLIGSTIVSVGLGGDPFTVTGGKVYLTEKYEGAPFGLSIVNPAVAGPFDLGKVIVRARVEVDQRTAALTVTTGEIPHILRGIPLQIKHVNVSIDRNGFTFNPTNCNPLAITGAIGAVEGATSPVSTPFQVTNCAALKFTPTVAVATKAKASKANGASLSFKIAYPKGALGSQSWFNEAKFDIPKQLPARLTTIQKACLAATFESNRSACPSASKIGTAIVKTPVLPVPLTGPVYFVSYGGAKFPDAVLVLDGYGVHIELHGETFISGKTGVTSATFRNTPDVPFESIEVNVPTGPFSEFGANLPAKAKYNFCGQKLTMPTLFKAQNGLEIHRNTAVSVSGCGKALTRKQKLAAALKACHRKHNMAKRAACERAARKKYGPVKKKKK